MCAYKEPVNLCGIIGSSSGASPVGGSVIGASTVTGIVSNSAIGANVSMASTCVMIDACSKESIDPIDDMPT